VERRGRGEERQQHHVPSHDVGGDNNGLRTAPLLEGACYAYALWKKPQHEQLLRRLIRGFSSWALAMVKPGASPKAPS